MATARLPFLLLLLANLICSSFANGQTGDQAETCAANGTFLLQKGFIKRAPLENTTSTQGVLELLESGGNFPMRVGITHHSLAVNDMGLLQSMARLGFPLEQPRAAAEHIRLPWLGEGGDVARPLVSCPAKRTDMLLQEGTEADKNLQQAVTIFCQAGLGELVEFFVDGNFSGTYNKLKGADGWIDKAFVAFMGLRSSSDKIGAEMDLLVQSVHHFSEKPVLVTNFGDRVPSSWTPKRFPNLVLLHARSTRDVTAKSFNFNKLTSMLFTKVKTGIALDADQWVNHGLDYLFGRAAEESTKDYPYPILPVHWMSRDPESNDMKGYPEGYAWHFVAADAPKRSMRWGHAHPTWTHHALPWLARWTSFVLAPTRTSPPRWLLQQGWIEDEDLLNVGLWAEGVTKQWCKYDTPSPSDFTTYLQQRVQNGGMLGPDSKWYPHGIAYIFFTAHDAKKPEESYGFLKKLWDDSDDKRKAIYYRGQWFGSGKALREFDPGLKCMA
uniref:Uncharacterized protein n=1 Tax=Pyrodinium bahamense TaxID=73915 RepID=A0A7S0B1H8_9DINO